jgi:carbon storage regulator CsrA
MLVLSRKANEAVMVGVSGGTGRELKVTVLQIRKGVVKLGFEVDPAVPVHRLEVWERIRDGDEPRSRVVDPTPPSDSPSTHAAEG